MYDGSAFYKVSENTFVQAGDIEYGNINNLDYLELIDTDSYTLSNVEKIVFREYVYTDTELMINENIINKKLDDDMYQSVIEEKDNEKEHELELFTFIFEIFKDEYYKNDMKILKSFESRFCYFHVLHNFPPSIEKSSSYIVDKSCTTHGF